MLSPTKVKCPKCGRRVLKRVLKITEGKCNNCGYLVANSISTFMQKAKLPTGNLSPASLA